METGSVKYAGKVNDGIYGISSDNAQIVKTVMHVILHVYPKDHN